MNSELDAIKDEIETIYEIMFPPKYNDDYSDDEIAIMRKDNKGIATSWPYYPHDDNVVGAVISLNDEIIVIERFIPKGHFD